MFQVDSERRLSLKTEKDFITVAATVPLEIMFHQEALLSMNVGEEKFHLCSLDRPD